MQTLYVKTAGGDFTLQVPTSSIGVAIKDAKKILAGCDLRVQPMVKGDYAGRFFLRDVWPTKG